MRLDSDVKGRPPCEEPRRARGRARCPRTVRVACGVDVGGRARPYARRRRDRFRRHGRRCIGRAVVAGAGRGPRITSHWILGPWRRTTPMGEVVALGASLYDPARPLTEDALVTVRARLRSGRSLTLSKLPLGHVRPFLAAHLAGPRGPCRRGHRARRGVPLRPRLRAGFHWQVCSGLMLTWRQFRPTCTVSSTRRRVALNAPRPGLRGMILGGIVAAGVSAAAVCSWWGHRLQTGRTRTCPREDPPACPVLPQTRSRRDRQPRANGMDPLE